MSFVPFYTMFTVDLVVHEMWRHWSMSHSCSHSLWTYHELWSLPSEISIDRNPNIDIKLIGAGIGGTVRFQRWPCIQRGLYIKAQIRQGVIACKQSLTAQIVRALIGQLRCTWLWEKNQSLSSSNPTELPHSLEKRGLHIFILLILNGLGSMERYRNSLPGQRWYVF